MATVTITIRDAADDDVFNFTNTQEMEALSLDVRMGATEDEIGDEPTLAQRAAMFCCNVIMGNAERVVGYEGIGHDDIDEWTIPSFIHDRETDES